MEKDDEVAGKGNSYTTEFRQYDTRIGRWKSLDPLMGLFPHQSGYVAYDNNPIYFNDPKGASSDGPGDEDTEVDEIEDPIVAHRKQGDTSLYIRLIAGSANPENFVESKEIMESGWDYIFVTDMKQAKNWVQKNYREGEITTLVIGTHGGNILIILKSTIYRNDNPNTL